MHEGYWLNGELNGKGRMIFPTGEVYEGEHQAHVKQGKGIYTWPCGQRYEGHYN